MKKQQCDSALLQVFHDHHDSLLGFIKKRVTENSLAEDILHDLYLKITNLHVSDPVKYPKAYVYRMANNLIIDNQRRLSARPGTPVAEHEEVFSEITPDLSLEYSQRLKIVVDAIKELPEKTQMVFRMHRFDELNKSNIAIKMGISVNMVEKHLRRGLQYCKEKIEKQE